MKPKRFVFVCVLAVLSTAALVPFAFGAEPLFSSGSACPGVPVTPTSTHLVETKTFITGAFNESANAPLPVPAQVGVLDSIHVRANCPAPWRLDLYLHGYGDASWPRATSVGPPVSILVLPGTFELWLDKATLKRAGLSGFASGGGSSHYFPGAEYVAVLDPATGVLSAA
jgi:hypothetical protein